MALGNCCLPDSELLCLDEEADDNIDQKERQSLTQPPVLKADMS